MWEKFSIFLIFIFSNISLSFSNEILNCSPLNLTVDITNDQKINIKSPVVNFTYNRDGLAIYLYPGTPSVNLYLNDTSISAKVAGNFNLGGIFNMNNIKTYETEIFGIANIANVSDFSVGVKDCDFFVLDKKTGSFFNDMLINLDSMLFRQVEQCLSIKLCQALGPIRYKDLVKGKMEPRDFGPMSIWSPNLHQNFPKMIPPQLSENNHPKKRANLVDATDSIIRMVADKFYRESNGMIDIPDVTQKVFTATNGTFSGLNNLQRAESIQIRVSSPSENPITFGFAFGIPEGHLVYEDYKAFRFMPFMGSICAEVKDLLFKAVISMDFSQQYCRPSLIEFSTLSPGTANTYTCGQMSFFTNPIMKWFLNAWNEDIIKSVEKQVEWTLGAYIYERFDCENFRPNDHTTDH